MASRRKEISENAQFQIMRLISKYPNISTRKIASEVGVSNGAAFYLLNSLIEKGFIKFENFINNKNKKKYTYLLTPTGIKEKYDLTLKFLERKKLEYKELKIEIQKLENEKKTNNDFEIEECPIIKKEDLRNK